MSEARALQIYIDFLRRFQHQIMAAPTGLEETLEQGLSYLMERLHLETFGLFWWHPQRKTLNMQYSLHQGVLMEGEEEIIIDEESALRPLSQEHCPVVVSTRNPWVAYLPLHSGSELIGAVRLERRRTLPKGRVLGSLPSFCSEKTQSSRAYPLLEDIADILSQKLDQLSRDEKTKRRAQYLKASSEVATAVFERPRLRHMLQAVSESIVKRLNFDRIRFYLVDNERLELRGVMGLQIPSRVLELENESYPLKEGTNSLVDTVLVSPSEATVRLVGGRVAYVPLAVNSQVIGCLAVDNLLSQQLINEDQMESLRVLSGQIGLAVLNSRLFEDIEQQAITDGLTKLYVYRYFQERLKEEMDRADRYTYSVALVMMDVDNFKQMNDTYGHQLGDKVLEFLAQTIKANIRRIDLAARYAGDEFVLVLPEITEQEVWLMGERLLGALKKCNLTSAEGAKISVNVTMGVSMYPSDAHSGRDLIEAADRALYWGKRNTRGALCFYRNIAGDIEKTA